MGVGLGRFSANGRAAFALVEGFSFPLSLKNTISNTVKKNQLILLDEST